MDIFALRPVGSSQTRDQTPVPCTGRRIPNHWTTGEVLLAPCSWLPLVLIPSSEQAPYCGHCPITHLSSRTESGTLLALCKFFLNE